MDIRITRFQPAHAEAFASLNRAWLVENELLSDTDEEILADPIGRIIEPGGHIFVALQDEQVIGTCALLPHAPDAFEMAKVTVARAARGRALGRRLVEAALAFAREQGRRRVMLLSNSRMATAIRLYEALGFRHRSLPADVKYIHADVCMEMLLTPPTDIHVQRLDALGEREIEALGDVLIDCVEGGDSVSFMWPMTRAKADAFWRDVAASVERGERMVLAAYDATGTIVGTVQVVFAQPENQPHRGDIAKMLVRGTARRRGIGAMLLEAAEGAALEAGRTLLVLDTASPAAARLYAKRGWQLCGEIPDYALMPDGAPCATTIFFKALTR